MSPEDTKRNQAILIVNEVLAQARAGRPLVSIYKTVQGQVQMSSPNWYTTEPGLNLLDSCHESNRKMIEEYSRLLISSDYSKAE